MAAGRPRRPRMWPLTAATATRSAAWSGRRRRMCEPFMLAKTGLTVAEHQARTVANYLELRSLAPELPFVPVLRGWSLGDYLHRCVELYERAGVNLAREPLVGVG